MCEKCQQIAQSQVATTPKLLLVPDYPFQMMLSDYFKLGGHHYLAMACRYSSWSSVYKAKDCTSKEVVSRLRNTWERSG